MNPIQESKQELEASIRYAENAIASAKQTIESIAKSQEQTGREEALQTQVTLLEERIKSLEYDLTAKTSQAEAWKKEAREAKEGRPTMPVIPKAVAIAIFREGVAHGVSSACDELDNDAGITIEETGYTGDFEVSFNRWIDLSDHLDLDWMRDKVGDYDEASVIEALKNLCADKEFECRIHGVDDQEEKKND